MKSRFIERDYYAEIERQYAEPAAEQRVSLAEAAPRKTQIWIAVVLAGGAVVSGLGLWLGSIILTSVGVAISVFGLYWLYDVLHRFCSDATTSRRCAIAGLAGYGLGGAAVVLAVAIGSAALALASMWVIAVALAAIAIGVRFLSRDQPQWWALGGTALSVTALLVAAASTGADAVLLIASLIAFLGLVAAGLGLQWLCLAQETRWSAVGAGAVFVAGAALVASVWFTMPPLVIIGAGLLLILGVVALSKSLPKLTENWGWFRSATIFLLGMAVAVAVTVSITGGAEWPLWMTAIAVLLAAGIAYALVFDGVELVALLLVGLAVTAVVADRVDRTPTDPHPDAQMRIVAIGDSYISGEGADRFFPGTNVVKENECRRTSTAYPYLVAEELGMGLDFVACSGAQTRHVDQEGQQPNSPPDVAGGKPQLDSLQPDGREIAAVLVSIGGNDVGFGAIATACIAPGSCDVHRTPLLRRISDLGSRDGGDEPPIERVYKAIKEKVGPEVPVVAMPYPLILNEGGCDESLLGPEEHAFLFEFTEVLNDRARTAAERAGVHWLEPAIDAFEKARICDGTPAVNMLDLTPQEGTLVDRLLPVNWVHGSAHPNPEGHRLIAAKLTELLEEIEAGGRPVNPEPNPLALFSLTLPSPVRRVSTRSLEIPENVSCPVGKLPISALARNERLGQELRLSGLKPDSLVCYTEPDGGWAFITADADGNARLVTVAPTDGSTEIVIYQRASGSWSVNVAEFCELDPNCAHDLLAIETWTGDQIRRTAKASAIPALLLFTGAWFVAIEVKRTQRSGGTIPLWLGLVAGAGLVLVYLVILASVTFV